MAETSGELFERSQAAFAKAKADRDTGLADAGDDEGRKAEVTEAYNRALGDATELASQFETQRDAEEKEASHARAAQITEREKLLESLSKPPTQRQVEATAPESKRSASYEAPGWVRDLPAFMQGSDVLKRSGSDAAEEAEKQMQALDAFMAWETPEQFQTMEGPEMQRALADISAPRFSDKGDTIGPSGIQRAATDFHVPYTSADGGVYIPEQVVPEVTSADVPSALNLLSRVTRVPSAVGEGHLARINEATVSELSYATTPSSNLGDDTNMAAFSARRYYSEQIADNVMMRGPGYARTIRDTLMYAGRHQISVEIVDGQATSFTGLAALGEDVSWGDASVTIGQILNQIGSLSAKYRDFPPGGRAWVMTQPTFYGHVLPLEVTSNKGTFISAVDETINGVPVYFTPAQTASNRMHNLTGAADGDPVAVYGNMRHYYVVEVNRPTISRRPAVNYEEMATRFRMHYNAAGLRGRDIAFVMADSA